MKPDRRRAGPPQARLVPLGGQRREERAGPHLEGRLAILDEGLGAQVGNILPWFNEGTFKLRTVYGNRGYLQIVSSLIICFPTLPSDHINVAWVASYGAGASKVNSTPLVFKIK